ncbi:MAG: prepilin-type N-terminal cleavage/methylation domain-containing protein [Lachnospiraceae bacterium]|nr:prepilin-type N-terminal cleavage/methylation domain-containing protein [Lachnospiraceae bacterium]
MKKNIKKNNKGFSLVELIVVVLIMAIIAVALAPQVMKWVDNARITADLNTAGVIKSAAQVAYADFYGKGGKLTKDFTAKIVDDGTELSDVEETSTKATSTDDTGKKVEKTLEDILNSNFDGSAFKMKHDKSATYDITITTNGTVTVKTSDDLTEEKLK